MVDILWRNYGSDGYSAAGTWTTREPAVNGR
jgi:hypothetical protein